MNLPVNMRVEQAKIIYLHSPLTYKRKTAPTNHFYGQKSALQDYVSCLFTDCEAELVNVKDTELDNDEAVEASLTPCDFVEGEMDGSPHPIEAGRCGNIPHYLP